MNWHKVHHSIQSVLIILIVFSFSEPLHSEISSSISLPKSYYSTTLYKGLDVNSLSGKMYINKQISDKSDFKLQQQLNLTLHHTPGFLRQWKVDELLNFTFSRAFQHKKHSAIIEGNWDRFIDQKAVPYEQMIRPDPHFPVLNYSNSTYLFYDQESNISKSYLGIGGAVSLPKIIVAEGTVGPIYENRRSTTREGIRMRLRLDHLQSVTGLKAKGWMNRLNIGNDYGWQTTFTNDKKLTEGASNRASIYYSQNKQYEDLYSVSSFGQRRDEQILFDNELITKTAESFTIVWQSELNRRRSTHIRGGSEKSDFDFGWINRFELGAKGENWQGVSYGGIDLQEQQYAGGLSQGKRKSLGLGVVYFPSLVDSVSLRSLVIKYSYDTPDESDFNDRDELRFQIEFASGFKVTPELELSISLETDLRHLVYVFRSRSGENRWQRVFRLAMSVPWQKQTFRNSAHYAVISNYTDYDYLPAADNLSRVYRAFTINDTVSIELGTRSTFEVNFAALIDDHGRLLWDEWIQNKSEEGRGYTTTVVGTWNGENSIIKYGWNWHTRKTDVFLQSGVTILGESNYTQGPILFLRSNWSDRIQSDLTARWSYVIDRQRGSYRLPDVNYQLVWAL